MTTLSETPAERFLCKLRHQIRKSFIFYLCFILGGFCVLSSLGCVKKENRVLPLGTWKREGTYLGGKFSHERRAKLTLTHTSFELEQQNCEIQGTVSYQSHVMILNVQQSDCQGISPRQKIYYGFNIDPADGKMRIFYNNQYNDTIRDVYVKVP